MRAMPTSSQSLTSAKRKSACDFFTRKARELAGDVAPDDGLLTVAKALEAYFAERATPGAKGFKGLAKDRAAAKVRILPELGEIRRCQADDEAHS